MKKLNKLSIVEKLSRFKHCNKGSSKEEPPTEAEPKLVQPMIVKGGKKVTKRFSIPPVALLDSPIRIEKGIYEDVVSGNKKIMQKRLLDFGIKGRFLGVQHGPVVSVYEFEPAPGIKVNRIVNLADDLALALSAISIRIVAPIPGKSVVGIEVPNPVRETVFLREVIESDAFQGSKSKLPFALGVDISRKPYVIDFLRMPHLLVGGSSGSGKIVSINGMICSILLKATPDEVRFVMIDTKIQELSDFDGIPHLLLPIVTNPKKAAMILKWLVEEMERRYTVLAEKGVRNFEHYHQKAAKTAEGFERLPYLVVVVDELADLMMVDPREAEEAITRLAQMAKVVGIHLLLATQRPSVDVLIGIIKANFPARIAFQVTSKTESRTILDTSGAEHLLGSGDMLFLPPGSSKLIRLHGAFISSQEVKRVVDFLKKQGKPSYLPSTILEAPRTPIKQKEYDEKYDKVLAFVAEVGEASISNLQKRFRIGYNRAVRIIEKMEEDGIVGPARGVKPRKVIVKKIE